MKYDKCLFMNYVIDLLDEMDVRKIKYQDKYYYELCDFCREYGSDYHGHYNYPEHNERYLQQCFYNLQEKYDRGIITEAEYKKIQGVMYDE